MNFKIPETVPLPGSAVSDLIHIGDGDAALLYLYLSACGGNKRTPLEISADLSWSTERTRLALDRLISHALMPGSADAVKSADSFDDKHPKPASKTRDAGSEMQEGKPFHTLVQEVQRLFGRMLSSDELVRLFGIHDSLGLPAEVIMQLVVYCMSEAGTRDGKSSPLSMRYIEKAAYTWEREGIFTLERAEQYIKERAEKKQAASKIKTLLQIHDRNFSPSERKYVDSWIALGFSLDAIAIAYDKTVTRTGKLSWGYMNSIINSWHGKGIYTAGDILAKDTRTAANSSVNRADGFGTPDENEVVRINRILSSLDKEK